MKGRSAIVSVRSISITLAACAALSACNTTDALTPRVGLGDEVASAPVTQHEVERMAAAPEQPTYGAQNDESYQSSYQQQAYSSSGGSSATLDEQADALRSGGSNPFASKPIDDGRQPADNADSGMPSQSDEQREADRRLSDTQPQQQSSQPDEQPQAAAQQPDEAQQQASLPPVSADGATIRFLPIIGAPVESVTPLSRQLGVEARANGLTIKASGDTDTAYILKGYLSTFADGPQITVSYVWDVLDKSGARLHRIQGTESVPLKRGDPWAAVPAATMQKIASKTIADFDSWRQTRGG